jgi:hypothetical protein
MSTISFNASSTLANNVGAHVNVYVDGQKIGSTYVGSKTATYSFNAPTLATGVGHDIQLVYDNDTVVSGKDRNLFLNSITVDGKTVAATSSYETYHSQGQGDWPSTGNMYWNGTAEFKLPSSMFPGSSTPTSPPPPPASPPPPPPPPPPTSTSAFYVSTTGSDTTGDGTSAHPFASLNKALSAMQSSSTIHTTYLEGGTYHLGSAISIGTGNNGDTIASAPGQQAVLDGGGSLSTLLQLNGASGVTLQGLTLQNTAANTRAALVLNGASNNSIIDNHFANNGEGMLVNNSSNYNTVSGNEIDNSSTSAIEVQDGSSHNTFDSNLINGTGAIGTAGGGFMLHGVNYNTISHNLVENTAGMGIGVENWDNYTINVGNQILNNIVQNTNTSSASTDSGAIYELGRSQVDTQSVISGNYITGPATAGAGSGAHIVGIYLDDYTDGVQVTNNIVHTINMHGLQIHGGSNVTVSNNIFDLGSSGHSAILLQSTYATAVGTPQPMTNNVIKTNIFASSESNPIAFDNISGGTPTIDNNFYMDLIHSSFQMNGFSQTNAHYGDAQFANEAGGNYNLASTSPALAIGFHQIDQTAMGLHPTTNHWYA